MARSARSSILIAALVAFMLGIAPAGRAQESAKKPVGTLYVVPYSHLDTQWRWTFPTTIREFVRKTLDENIARFSKYPKYVFTFTGALRYEMMKEYYPVKFERVKQLVAEGRWHVGGSSMEEGDVNAPSPESIFRQVLYGNQWFRQHLGKESVDYMLPDCFGFQAHLPSVWAHSGLKGFSTQKLSWGSAMGIPFQVGVWEGPDGRGVVCALDGTDYTGRVPQRLDLDPYWIKRLERDNKRCGVPIDYRYFGVGDRGGAPRDEDVAMAIRSLNNLDAKIQIKLASSDQMFRDLTEAQVQALPRYRGDLLLTEHSAGSLTSQAYLKRWNRKNEQLADSAERAAVAASWLGGMAYPRERLLAAWKRVLQSQFHDILPGTSIPAAYNFSWNDEALALNIFAHVLERAAGSVIEALDTRASGAPLVVYNPLATARQDVVEATVEMPQAPQAIAVFGPDGAEVPSQIVESHGNKVRLLLLANVAPVSWTCYDVRAVAPRTQTTGALRVTPTSLENASYRVTIDANGDPCSIIDKQAGGRELLAKPARLVFMHHRPAEWPAWNMDWQDQRRDPIDAVGGPAEVRVVERGPVRVALEIRRRARNSIFTQRVRLSAGDAGRRVEFATFIDWQTRGCALKAVFPLTVSNPLATYNLGLGTIARGNNNPKKYEVPSREWFDLTDRDGAYGVSVLEDCKFGSDKPTDDTLRLTLLYSPEVRKDYKDQYSQDWGRHDVLYALYGHTGDWRQGATEWQARRVNQPLVAFQAPSHAGALGRAFSLVQVDTPQVDVRAVKLAEEDDRVVIRLQELTGKQANNVHVAFASPVLEATETDAQERRIGEARVVDGQVVLDMTPFSPRTIAVRLARAPVAVAPPTCKTVTLPCDTDVCSFDGARADGAFDEQGRTLPAELLPNVINHEGVVFRLGERREHANNAVTCRGQQLPLPAGRYDDVYVLAAATESVTAPFLVDGSAHTVKVPCWTGYVGQWDNRVWDRSFDEIDYICDGKVVSLQAGYIERQPVAWYATHRHLPKGNDPYQFSYLYALRLPVTGGAGAKTLTLPNDPRVRVLAVTTVTGGHDNVAPAQPLYDDLSKWGPVELRGNNVPKRTSAR